MSILTVTLIVIVIVYIIQVDFCFILARDGYIKTKKKLLLTIIPFSFLFFAPKIVIEELKETYKGLE